MEKTSLSHGVAQKSRNKKNEKKNENDFFFQVTNCKKK